jgi:Periplasmic binding protein-like domain
VLGFKVRSEVSVVGFDDLPMARWAWPPLTTVRQPLTEMAAPLPASCSAKPSSGASNGHFTRAPPEHGPPSSWPKVGAVTCIY